MSFHSELGGLTITGVSCLPPAPAFAFTRTNRTDATMNGDDVDKWNQAAKQVQRLEKQLAHMQLMLQRIYDAPGMPGHLEAQHRFWEHGRRFSQ